jgi:hypothetical protein
MLGLPEKKTQTCSVCGRGSPEVNTNYTLIGDSHGWRSLVVKTLGRRELVWFCPDCWRQRKSGSQAAGR